MEVQELRIGNLVTTIEGTKHFGKELRVEFITDNNCYDLDAPLDSINGYELNKVIPIPLTEEWLVRFGFKMASGGISYNKDDLNIYLGDTILSGDEGATFFNCWRLLDHSPKHVHQLQNLYFALTGEELELIDPSDIYVKNESK